MVDLRIKMVRSILRKSDKIRFQNRKFDYPQLKIIKDLYYSEKEDGNEFYSMDLFLPEKREGLLPLIIDIHGGGFVYGDKSLNRWTSAEMASRGYIVASLNYPLVPDVTIPQQLEALFEAFEYIRKLGQGYPIDFHRVFIKGDSAGGTLALISAAISNLDNEEALISRKIPFKFKALSLVHPVVNIHRKDFLGYVVTFYKEKGRPLRSPVELSAYLPPTWIVSSRNDLFFNQEAQKFVGTMRKQGKKVQYHEFDFTLKKPLIHIFMVTMNSLPQSQRLYNSLDRFFRTL